MYLEEESKSRKLDIEKYITRTSERQMRTYEKMELKSRKGLPRA